MEDESGLDKEAMIEKVIISCEKSPLKQKPVVEVKNPEIDNVFEAEKILKKRKNKNKIEYFVKWKGYSSKSNTWEPKQNILDPMLIQDFQEKIKKTKKSNHVQINTKM